MCKGSHRQYAVPGGAFINETPPDSFYNLPLVLAYCALDDVMEAAIDQKLFACKRRGLEARMAASMGSLNWKNYALVDTGRKARNDLAHRAIILNRERCLELIGAIEIEFKAWGLF